MRSGAPPDRSLILIIGGDEAARAVARATALRLPSAQVVTVAPTRLTSAMWSHRLDSAGRVITTIDLPSSRRIANAEVAAVFVATGLVTLPRFASSAPADRDYAVSEFNALIVSWLHSLGDRVINACGGTNMLGPAWTRRKWLDEARRAGIPVTRGTTSSAARLIDGWQGTPYDGRMPISTAVPADAQEIRTCLSAGSRVISSPPACENEPDPMAVLRLQARSRCRLIELVLARTAHGLELLEARPGATIHDPYGLDVAAVSAIAELLADAALARESGQ